MENASTLQNLESLKLFACEKAEKEFLRFPKSSARTKCEYCSLAVFDNYDSMLDCSISRCIDFFGKCLKEGVF